MYYHPKYYAEQRAKRKKLQAASSKRQAEPSSDPSKNLSKLQAPSGKRQA